MINWCEYNPMTHGNWDDSLKKLVGSNFFQTVAWIEVKRSNGWRVMYMLASKNDAIVSMAAVLYRRKPLSGAMAWLPGGICGEPHFWVDSFKSALKNKLDLAWLYLRINSLGFEAKEQIIEDLQLNKWSRPSAPLGTGQSLIYDLVQDEASGLAAMSANWRHNLKRSRKYGLSFERWSVPDAPAIMNIYRSMERYKGLAKQLSLNELEAMLSRLKDSMILYKCETLEGKIIAIRACVLFNNTAFDLLAAAAPIARKQYASHGLLWALLNDCRNQDIARYDLGGVDLVNNKGVYDFKRGIGANPIVYLGEWECASQPFIKSLINSVLSLKKKISK